MSERGDGMGPERDPLAWEETVRAVMRSAEPELRRRRNAAWILPDRWTRPVLAAAASLILLACGSLLWSGTGTPLGDGRASGFDPASGIQEALYPPVVAQWMGGRIQPTVEEFVFASIGE